MILIITYFYFWILFNYFGQLNTFSPPICFFKYMYIKHTYFYMKYAVINDNS